MKTPILFLKNDSSLIENINNFYKLGFSWGLYNQITALKIIKSLINYDFLKIVPSSKTSFDIFIYRGSLPESTDKFSTQTNSVQHFIESTKRLYKNS